VVCFGFWLVEKGGGGVGLWDWEYVCGRGVLGGIEDERSGKKWEGAGEEMEEMEEEGRRILRFFSRSPLNGAARCVD